MLTPRPGSAPARRLRALAFTTSLLLVGACTPDSTDPSSVILLVVDTLRADHLGSYGYPGPITPNLDRFAEQSVQYERCFSQAPWTKPAMASLFTSLYVQVHGQTNHEGRYWGGPSGEMRTGVLPASAVTLAELLREKGYHTAGFVANPWLGSRYGFAQGFDHFDDEKAESYPEAAHLIERAQRWLDRLDGSERYFLFLHFMDVHAPYDAPREDYELLRADGETRLLDEEEAPFNRWQNLEVRPDWATDALRHEVAYWKARYASGVRAFDRRLARFLDYLENTGRLDRSYVFLTSDHGEELFEHGGWSHGQSLYDHQLHVPLLIRRPEGRQGGTRIADLVELIDVMPTVLAIAGIEPPPGLQGRALLRPGNGSGKQPRLAFATATQGRPGLYAVRTARYKLLLDVNDGSEMLFDLVADPSEQRDTAGLSWGTARRLRGRLFEHITSSVDAAIPETETAAIPSEVQERLRALGYLD